MGYYLCETALKTAIPFKSEKNFSYNHSAHFSVSRQYHFDPDFVDQEYGEGGRKAV